MQDKSYAYTTRCQGATAKDTLERHKHTMCAEPVGTPPYGAARRGENARNQCWEIRRDEKSNAVITGHQSRLVCVPVCVASRGRNPDNLSDRTAGMPTQQHLEARTDGKTNTLTSVSKDNLVAEPITNICQVGSLPMPNGEPSTSAGFRVYSPDA